MAKRKRPVSLSEGAMIQREYVNRMLQRVRPTAKDMGKWYPIDFRAGVEWLKAKVYRFLATEPKRTKRPGGLGRNSKRGGRRPWTVSRSGRYRMKP